MTATRVIHHTQPIHPQSVKRNFTPPAPPPLRACSVCKFKQYKDLYLSCSKFHGRATGIFDWCAGFQPEA